MAGVRARQVGLAYDTVPAGDDPDDYLDERQLAVKKWSRRHARAKGQCFCERLVVLYCFIPRFRS